MISEDVLAGRPLGCRAIDVHAHLGRWHAFHIAMPEADDMVRIMDRIGIEACISAAHASIGPDFRLGNDMVIQAMRKFAGRIYGYCTVNPRYPEAEMREELARCLEAGMKGIKFHPDVHQYAVDGPAYRPAWETAEDLGLPVLVHTGGGSRYDDPLMLAGPAKEFPNAKILIGHCGLGLDGIEKAIRIAREHPNTYLDLTSSTCHFGLVERLVSEVGEERVLFGTDLPFLDPRQKVGQVAFARISEEAKQKILGENAAGLFKIS